MKPKAPWIRDLAVEESCEAEEHLDDVEHRESVQPNHLKSAPKLSYEGPKQSG